jgi:NADH-quinone oxidoreductase subunit J
MVQYFFVILAVFAVATAVAMVVSRNTVNSALFLVLNFVSIAGIFLLLKARFLAVVQVLVYAGAIMVLFLFVIMLLNIDDEENLFNKFRIKYFFGFIFGAIVLAQIIYSIIGATHVMAAANVNIGTFGTVEAVGNVLFTRYLIAFELTAILLTAAVVGALFVAQHKIKSSTDD